MGYYGKCLVTTSSGNTIKIVGVSNSTSQHLATLSAHVFDDHISSLNSIAWAPHELGLCLACGSSDGNISVLTTRFDGG
ncbi:hypothetical protein CsSME_00007781 [Camellia sinensis var. sinensis]